MQISEQVKKNVYNLLIQSGINVVNGLVFSECAKRDFSNPIMNGIQRFAHLSGGINWTDVDTPCDELTKFLDQTGRAERNGAIPHKSIKEGLVTASIGTACTFADDVLNKFGISSGNHASDIFSCTYTFYDATESLGKLWTLSKEGGAYDIENAKSKFNKFLVGAVGGVGLWGIKKLFGMCDSISETRENAIKLAKCENFVKEITRGEVDLSTTAKVSFLANEALSLGGKVATAFLMNKDALCEIKREWIRWDPNSNQAIYENKQVYDLTKLAVKLGGTIGTVIGSQFLQESLNDAIFNRIGLGINNTLSEEVQKIMSTPELLLKASSDTDMAQSLSSITSDIQKITKDVKKLMEAQSALLQSVTKSSEIGMAGISLLEAFDNSSMITSNALKLSKLEENFTYEKGLLDTMQSEIFCQPRTVIERGALNFYTPQIHDISLKLSQLKEKFLGVNNSYNQNKFFGTFLPLIGLSLKAYDIAGLGAGYVTLCTRQNNVYPGHEMFAPLQNIALDSSLNLPKEIVRTAGIMIAKGISNDAQNKILELGDMSVSLERANKLLKFIDSVENTSYVKYYKNPNLDGIKLQKVEVSVAGEKRLCVEDLTLSYGKNYLFTGKSGCGKTTLFSSLFGLPNFSDAITVKGAITYGCKDQVPAILLLTQNDNFAGNVTLLENIIYPILLNDEQQMKNAPLIERMLFEIQGINPDIHSDALMAEKEYGLPSRLFEVQQNMYTSFSGGQKKKIAIVGMVFNVMYKTGMLDTYFDAIENGKNHHDALSLAKKSTSPVIVMLDEIYNGLDDSSKKNATSLIKTYSPDKAITVTIEHQPQRAYYDYELHMKGNGQVNYTDLRSGYNKDLNHNFNDEIILSECCEEFFPLVSCYV